MKKNFKGFTLIECLVALGILGIASLTMAQIYATVARRNTMNHIVNTSLSNQMAYVEKYTDSETMSVYFGNYKKPDGTSKKDPNAADHKTPMVSAAANSNNYIKIIRCEPDGSADKRKHVDEETYSFPVDIYVLYSRDRSNQPSKIKDATGTPTDNPNFNSGGYDESQYNLRYKYVLGHTGT